MKSAERHRLWWVTADRCTLLRISPPSIEQEDGEIARTCEALGWDDLADAWRGKA